MKNVTGKVIVYAALALVGYAALAADKRPQRIGMVIGIKPDKIQQYKALHSSSNAGVRDLLSKYHIKNFSIYLQTLDDGKPYLFGYYEYDGSNYEADMARLAKEQRNLEWLAVTDAMQAPLCGQKSWTRMEEVYHNQ